ncbi:MAG: flagellar type III secretion system protein FliR [Tissierellia bacterium]|nr:flagellar type III secretion system protein FliR [Tissierellia bacterium]
MNTFIEVIINKYELFLIVFVRCSGIFLVSPFFSSQNIPNRFKVGLTFFLSIILTSTLQISVSDLEIPMIVLIFKELLVGSIIGFISYIFFSSFYVMGQIVDMNIGFGMINVVDPQNRIQVPLMGNFYYILALLLLLTIDGHHTIINSIVDSYEFIPIGAFKITENIAYFIINLISKMFILGFRLSMPVFFTIFLLDILLGILVRTIPQMNIFVVGLPLKIFIGIIAILISIPVFNGIVSNSFKELIEDINILLRFFSEG